MYSSSGTGFSDASVLQRPTTSSTTDLRTSMRRFSKSMSFHLIPHNSPRRRPVAMSRNSITRSRNWSLAMIA
jgi:hypothetical protein